MTVVAASFPHYASLNRRMLSWFITEER